MEQAPTFRPLILTAWFLLASCALPPDRAPLGTVVLDSTVDDRGGAGLEAGRDLAAPDGANRPAHWHVSRGQIRDALGRAVIMRGINLSNRHKHPPYFSFHGQQDYTRVRSSWGLNAIRYLISWAAIEPAKGKYDTSYLHEVARRMAMAREANLLVVVDMHQDVYGEGFNGNGAPRWTCSEARYKAHKPKSPWFMNYSSPQVMACFDQLYTSTELQQHYAEAWRRVARRLQEFDNIVGFDVINEPHWGSHDVYSFGKKRLQPMYDRVVKAVRSEAPGWVAFLEPSVGRNMGIAPSLEPFAYKHTVYAPHSYDVQAEQGKGFDPKNRKFITDKILSLASEAKYLNSALWIGEYGGNQDRPGIFEYMDAQYDGAAAVAASTMYWAYDKDSGYGPLYPDGTEKKKLLAAIIRPYPGRVAGDPISYHYDDVNRTFTLTYTARADVTAPTEIIVPARAYAGGYQVVCKGCAFVKLGDVLRVTAPPTGSPAKVTVKPTS